MPFQGLFLVCTLVVVSVQLSMSEFVQPMPGANDIGTDKVNDFLAENFPDDFTWGVGTSAYQVGCQIKR